MYSSKWKTILDEVSDFTKDTNVWFRGHASTTYSLNSGLFRLNFDILNQYLDLERQLYAHFKSLGYMLHKEENPWNLLYSMQHHGVRTRLLDWSESFSVALFFAHENWRTNESAKLWMLDPAKLNYINREQLGIISPNKLKYPEEYQDNNNFHNINSLAIYPIKNSRRILAQHGTFTVQGNSMVSLEKESDGLLLTNDILKPIELPYAVKEDVSIYLKQNGLTKYSLFPDLDGLAAYVNSTLTPLPAMQ